MLDFKCLFICSTLSQRIKDDLSIISDNVLKVTGKVADIESKLNCKGQKCRVPGGSGAETFT